MPYKDQTSEAAKASRRRRTANYKRRHPEKFEEIHKTALKNWRQTEAGKRSQKAASLKCRFGVTLEWQEAKIAEQNGLCTVCGRPLDAVGLGGPATDHCHNTDKVRDIIHRTCNAAMGLFGDDPAMLRRAADYLEKHSGHQS